LAGSFLDTTVLIDLVDHRAPGKVKAEAFISANQPAKVPYYALRELVSGHLHYICQAHNVLLASSTPPEATLALLNRNPMEGRRKEARARILLSEMEAVFASNPNGQRSTVKREVLEALALRAARLWRKAHQVPSSELTQPLGCFNDGNLSYGHSGELKGPKDTFGCAKSERCAAAAYLYDKRADIEKLIDALHPSKLGALAGKAENASRRKALKELLAKGPVAFNKGRCRALGDAYFAAMSPPGFAVVTTNLSDHMPLCDALRKAAVSP